MSRQLTVEKIGKLSFTKVGGLVGNFSTVFKGKFEDIKDVAVKRLLRDKSRVNAMLLIKASDHPNVVQYICTETIDTDFMYVLPIFHDNYKSNFCFTFLIFYLIIRYLATEFCAGNLEDYVLGQYKEPRLGQSKEICRQITNGLQHLHLLKIVHGNLKPTNILISFAKGALTPQMKLRYISF